jgi:hypothetical protein
MAQAQAGLDNQRRPSGLILMLGAIDDRDSVLKQ